MKIFKMNDCDWWMAPTLEEAVADIKEYYGVDEFDFTENEPRELTEEEMDRIMFRGEDGEPVHSFREELRQRVELGQGTQMFGSTES